MNVFTHHPTPLHPFTQVTWTFLHPTSSRKLHERYYTPPHPTPSPPRGTPAPKGIYIIYIYICVCVSYEHLVEFTKLINVYSVFRALLKWARRQSQICNLHTLLMQQILSTIAILDVLMCFGDCLHSKCVSQLVSSRIAFSHMEPSNPSRPIAFFTLKNHDNCGTNTCIKTILTLW